MTSKLKCVTHAQATLQTMKQRAREDVSIIKDKITNKQFEVYLPASYVLTSSQLDTLVTQTYRDTLNIALAGIVDKKNDGGGYLLEDPKHVIYDKGEQFGIQKANDDLRESLRGLLDDIKD
jgi:hypothetical protein